LLRRSAFFSPSRQIFNTPSAKPFWAHRKAPVPRRILELFIFAQVLQLTVIPSEKHFMVSAEVCTLIPCHGRLNELSFLRDSLMKSAHLRFFVWRDRLCGPMFIIAAFLVDQVPEATTIRRQFLS